VTEISDRKIWSLSIVKQGLDRVQEGG